MDDSDPRAITSFRWPHRNEVPIQSHHARLVASASALGWQNAVAKLREPDAIPEIKRALESHLLASSIADTQPRKITIGISSMGHMTVSSAELSGTLYDFNLLADKPENQATVVPVYVSPHPITSSVFTTHKTSLRCHYDQARAAVSISQLPPTSAEVLLYNEQQEITEASLSTVYFQRKSTWITPNDASGCNLGLTRALALEKKWCQEGRICKSELRHGEIVKLSNCVRGFWLGRIVLRQEEGE